MLPLQVNNTNSNINNKQLKIFVYHILSRTPKYLYQYAVNDIVVPNHQEIIVPVFQGQNPTDIAKHAFFH